MMKELDLSKINQVETAELWTQGQLNLIFCQSKFICTCFQLTSEPETSESAKKAILSAAYSLAASANQVYYRLLEVYGPIEE